MDGHWDEDYLQRDLMISYSRGDLIPTIYTLEFLQLRSDKYIVQKEHLPNNYQLDSVNNLDDYFKYNCPSDDSQPKYF